MLKAPFDSNSIHGLALNIVKGKYKEITGNYSDSIKNLV